MVHLYLGWYLGIDLGHPFAIAYTLLATVTPAQCAFTSMALLNAVRSFPISGRLFVIALLLQLHSTRGIT